MDAAAARDVLGVGPAATPVELRAAYRAALRRAHPDHGGRDEAVRAVVVAYEVLLAGPAATATTTTATTTTATTTTTAGAGGPDPGPPPAATGLATSAVTVDGDTVAADLPAGDLFPMLVEVGHRLGEVAYVDELAGILEVVVTFAGYGACSVVLTLQGRATGTTEAWCTVEALGAGPAPPVDAVTQLLAEGLRTVADP